MFKTPRFVFYNNKMYSYTNLFDKYDYWYEFIDKELGEKDYLNFHLFESSNNLSVLDKIYKNSKEYTKNVIINIVWKSKNIYYDTSKFEKIIENTVYSPEFEFDKNKHNLIKFI